MLSEIVVNEVQDRLQIIAIPKDKILSLDEWKPILYNIAYLLPDMREESKVMENSDNGNQGIEFRRTQDNMRQSKNAWLRDGLAYVHGKVVDMSYEDFTNLEPN